MYAIFESNLLKAYGDGKLEGPLFKAQSEFKCCGPKTCDKYQEDAHQFYIFLIKNCGDTCYTMVIDTFAQLPGVFNLLFVTYSPIVLTP